MERRILCLDIKREVQTIQDQWMNGLRDFDFTFLTSRCWFKSFKLTIHRKEDNTIIGISGLVFVFSSSAWWPTESTS